MKDEKIFICHKEGKINETDARDNFPSWRNISSVLQQFQNLTSKINLSKQDKENLELLTFYLEKVVEHYDFDVPEFSFSILCSLIEAIGKYDSPMINGGSKRFLLAVEKYFDPRFVNDAKFMQKMKEVYKTIGRNSFTHSAERLHWTAQIGSKASFPLQPDSHGEYDLIGNKHLFEIATEVITNYFLTKKI